MRGDQLTTALEFWEIMMDGRLHPVEAFLGIKKSDGTLFSRKQIRRILDDLSFSPKLQIYTEYREDETGHRVEVWGTNYKPKVGAAKYLRKYCKACMKEKPISEFGINRNTASGRSYYCSDCSNEAARLYKAKNREVVLKKDRERKKRNRRLYGEEVRAKKRLYFATHPEQLEKSRIRKRERYYANVELSRKKQREKRARIEAAKKAAKTSEIAVPLLVITENGRPYFEQSDGSC